MASKRDLVEANAFNRRRLVTAFVSGAPGGREVEPQSPAKTIIAGVVLAVLVVGGAALAGVLKPGLPSNWDDDTLVVGKDTGARYLAYKKTLYPVVNTVSARLLVPAGQFRVVLAPDDKLADYPHGSTYGIVGAPDALPAPGRLVQTGWTSCLDQQRHTRLTVAEDPAVRGLSSRAGLLVQTGTQLSLVTGGHRFSIPESGRQETLVALGLEQVQPLHAPGRWADLFPAGPPLRPVSVPEAGQPAPSGWPLPSKASTLGTVLETSGPDGGTRHYLVRRRGLVPLSDVGFAMYQVSGGRDLGDPVRVDRAAIAQIPLDSGGQPYPDTWPTQQPTPFDGTTVCARLGSGVAGRELPTVSLAEPRTSLPTATGEVSAEPQGSDDAYVQPGSGALVRAVSGGSNRGTVFLVDSSRRHFALGGAESDVQKKLGYGHVDPPTVPPAWLEALGDGPELSKEAAQAEVTGPVSAAGGHS